MNAVAFELVSGSCIELASDREVVVHPGAKKVSAGRLPDMIRADKVDWFHCRSTVTFRDPEPLKDWQERDERSEDCIQTVRTIWVVRMFETGGE